MKATAVIFQKYEINSYILCYLSKLSIIVI